MATTALSVIKSLMNTDIKRSGLTDSDIKKLKYTPLTVEQTNKAVKKKVVSYKIPYFSIDGKQTSFYRIRFLEDPSKFGKSKKPQRYSQPPDTEPHLYFPPLIDWKKIAKDTNVAIIITEGEKKSAKACKEGLPCIGLGGVWSFMSAKHNKPLIDDFDKIEWQGREVHLVFDSDLSTNAQVSKALSILSKRLSNLGANIIMRFIPPTEEGEKQGLDDFLLSNSVEEFDDLEIEEYSITKELWRLNEEIAFIQSATAYWHFETRRLFKRENIIHDLYGARNIFIEEDGKMKEYNVAKEWCRWPPRRTHTDIEYEPGQPEVLDSGNLNIWRGWGTEPKRNDVFMKLWHKFMDFFFKENPDILPWVEQWMAYPIQHPGAKLFSCVLFYSMMTGTGKTWIGYFLKEIYGSNGIEIKQEDLHSTHNFWAKEKQFVLGDEITSHDKRREKDALNSMITRERVTVNIKYQPHYEVRDCINYLFTSQHPDALFLDRYDRRVLIHHAPEVKMPEEIRAPLHKFYHNGAGAAALHYYLLHQVDVSKFNPNMDAPTTKNKEEMKSLSLSDLDAFAQSLMEYPDSILRYSGVDIDRDLFTIDELMRLYDPDEWIKPSRIAMSKALARCGFKCYVTKINSTKKLWAVRNCSMYNDDVENHKIRVANYGGSVIFLEERRRAKYKKQK